MRISYKKIAIVLSFIISLVFVQAGYGSHFETPRILDVDYKELTSTAKREVDCLAENIYHEARTEGTKGQQAVALVTMNRLNNDKFPKKICEVVKQKTNGTCQFSWYCNKVKLNRSSDDKRQIRRHSKTQFSFMPITNRSMILLKALCTIMLTMFVQDGSYSEQL